MVPVVLILIGVLAFAYLVSVVRDRELERRSFDLGREAAEEEPAPATPPTSLWSGTVWPEDDDGDDAATAG
jgi:hypothetical protein